MFKLHVQQKSNKDSFSLFPLLLLLTLSVIENPSYKRTIAKFLSKIALNFFNHF